MSMPPASQTWTIQVIANEINVDGHTETAQLDVAFALIVSGVLGPSPLRHPDRNKDGTIDQLDAVMFLDGYLQGNSDYDMNGVTESADLFEFFRDFFSGVEVTK